MKRLNHFHLYELGESLGTIYYRSKKRYQIFAFELRIALIHLNKTLREYPGLSGRVARKLSIKLAKMHQLAFIKNHSGELIYSEENDENLISFEGWDLLGYYIQDFQTILREHLDHAAHYSVSGQGIYDVRKLIDEADHCFPNFAQAVMPEKSKTEWKSAGRCLAFELYSASGFHVARAVEGVLEVYSSTFGLLPRERRTWGQYISELRLVQKSSGGPDEKTLCELEQMKDDWRNPLMHPRVVLAEAEGRMLFANGESLIIAMTSEIYESRRD